MHTVFWWGDLTERDHFEEPDLDGRIILKWISKKWDEDAFTGVIWLRIGTGFSGRTLLYGVSYRTILFGRDSYLRRQEIKFPFYYTHKV
jgi:hypothetical protein